MSHPVHSNAFRTLGLWANATTSAVAGRAMQLTARLRQGDGLDGIAGLGILPGDTPLTVQDITDARTALSKPMERLEHALVWFSAVDAIDIAAVDAVAKSRPELARELWEASPESLSARHNLFVLDFVEYKRAEADNRADELFGNHARELCALLSPGCNIGPSELRGIYRRLEPELPRPVEAKSVEIIQGAEEPVEQVEPEILVIQPEPEEPGNKIDIEIVMKVRSTSETPLDKALARFRSVAPSIPECQRFFYEADTQLRSMNEALKPDQESEYRRTVDMCASALIEKIKKCAGLLSKKSRFEAMALLNNAKLWHPSAEVSAQINGVLEEIRPKQQAQQQTNGSGNYSFWSVAVWIILLIIFMRLCS